MFGMENYYVPTTLLSALLGAVGLTGVPGAFPQRRAISLEETRMNVLFLSVEPLLL